MHILNKVLLGFVAVLSVLFIFLAARTLNAHNLWRTSVRDHDEAIAASDEESLVLLNGERQGGEVVKLGVRQAGAKLHGLLVGRGSVWKQCDPNPITEEAGAIELTVFVTNPVPNGVEVGMPLHAFEEQSLAEGGRYLGKFTVTAASDQEVSLKPARRLWTRQIEALRESASGEIAWTLYERLPFDNADAFTNLTDDELAALFPEGVFPEGVPEYIQEGRALKTLVQEIVENVDVADAAALNSHVQGVIAAQDGPVWTVTDYETMFAEYHRLYAQGVNILAATEENTQRLNSANTQADAQRGFREEQIRNLKVSLEEAQRDRDAVLAHKNALETKIAELEQAIVDKTKQNEAMVAEIARIQLEASRIIDERARSMAAAE